MQTVSQEGNQDVRVGLMLELMVDGPDAQFTLQAAKGALDLRELHVARPQHRRVFAREIASQQIMAIALFGGF